MRPASSIKPTVARPTSEIQLIYNAGENRKHVRDFTSVIQLSGRWLLTSDVIALVLAFLCGGFSAWAINIHLFKGSFQDIYSFATLKQFIAFIGLGGLALLWLDTRGHYRQRLPFWESVGHIVTVSLAGFLICGFLQFVVQHNFSRLWLAFSWALFGIFLFTGRRLVRAILEKTGRWQIPAVLIGKGPSAVEALRVLKSEPGMGFIVTHQIESDILPTLAKPQAWIRLLRAHKANHIFLALEGSEMDEHKAALQFLVRERLPCSIIPPWTGLLSGTLSAHHFMLHDILLLHDTNRLYLPLPRLIKRAFDLTCASLAVLVTLPIFIIIALLVRRDGGPAFFRQARVGRHGEQFSCYKFRSMGVDAEERLSHYLAANAEAAAEWKQFQKLKKDVRITPFGQFLRRTSIDELPQLLNVIKGDMSLVGPRPIMPGQESYYEDDFVYYESVRPGITGPWQVSGRNTLTFRQRVTLEAYYARNWSLWMDIVILLKTVPTVMKKEQAF